MVHIYPSVNRPTAPLVSVCIANYNGMTVLSDCIASVQAQRGSASFEIIIHDDASSDDSVTWVRQHYPNVELLASSENVGFCVANNRMVTHAHGEYILLLNNDAALYEDALATLLDMACAQQRQCILSLPQYDWETGQLVDRGCLLDPFYNPVPNLSSAITEVAMVIGACLFLRRSLWNTLEGFPEWMGSLAEDMYLCCAARLRGHPVLVAADSGYRHRQGASFGGNRVNAGKLQTTYRRRALSEQNKTAVLMICTPGLVAFPLLILHCCVLASEGMLLTLLKRDTKPWKEIYGKSLSQLVKHRSDWYQKRKAMQKQRSVTTLEYWKFFICTPRKLTMLIRNGLPELR